jgi:hypothetical protein
MEIKVYDESGKIINIIPLYQVGGPVLPQYTPTETSMYRPQQSANTALEFSQRNLELQNQKEIQQQQLGMQRDAQLQNSYQTAMNLRFQKDQQELLKAREERYLKQLDLQNKKLELDQIKTAQTEFQSLLDLDNDVFLEGDNAKIQEQMKSDKMDDESFANLDLRDPTVVYDAMNKRRVYMSKYKDAYSNKKAYTDGIKILDNDENDKLIEQAAKGGFLDFDKQKAYTTSKLEYRKALEEFRKTGDKTILDNAKQHLDNISQLQTFINEDLYKKQQQLAEQEQETNIIVGQAEAKAKTAQAAVDQATADFKVKNIDLLTQAEKAKLETTLVDLEMKSMESKAIKEAWDAFKISNPDPTPQDIIAFRNSLEGKFQSLDDYYDQQVIQGTMTPEQRNALKTKTTTSTTTTYKIDPSNGQQYVEDGSKRIYNGYSTKDTGEFISGFYGPNNMEISMNKNGKDFKNGSISVDSSGNLIMNTGDVIKILGVSKSWLEWDETDIKEQIPTAVQLEDGNWKIPPSSQSSFGVSSTGGSSSTSTSTSTTTSGSYMGKQSGTPSNINW